MQLAPLPVVISLVMAALLAGAGNILPRRLLDALSILTALAVMVICLLLARACQMAESHRLVYWFGNWRPDSTPSGFPIGICFAIDTVGASLAATVALLVAAAMTFSWGYFKAVKSLYHALMLAFMAGMCGLCLTGDLFNLFVWFELMTAAAVGLCGYMSEESWPLLGGLNFAVTNTVGAFLSLGGVALLYAQTGALNMAEVATTLAKHNPGFNFLAVTFLLVIAGFLVKTAVVPFQFWLADAHAVAPTPVCVLLSGVMVELGLYAVGRVYWAVFAPAMAGHEAGIRSVLLLMGCLTAIVGAIYCFSQRHFKRLLAFSTVSHVGLMLIGVALLRADALGGTAVYLVGHAMLKGCLFLCAGILLHRFTSVDEFDLRGRGAAIPGIGVLMALAALGLAGVWPFATFFGEAGIHPAIEALHLSWVSAITIFAESLTAAAVLRVTARVFLGWGAIREASSHGAPHIPMGSETGGSSRTPAVMWAPAVVLLAGAAGIALWLNFRGGAATAAGHFVDSGAYQSSVLGGGSGPATTAAAEAPPIAMGDWVHAGIRLALMLALAAVALFPQMLGKPVSRSVGHGISRAMHPLRVLQSGRIGDYITWLVFGIATYGGLLLWWR